MPTSSSQVSCESLSLGQILFLCFGRNEAFVIFNKFTQQGTAILPIIPLSLRMFELFYFLFLFFQGIGNSRTARLFISLWQYNKNIRLSDMGTDKYLSTITDFKFKNKTQVAQYLGRTTPPTCLQEGALLSMHMAENKERQILLTIKLPIKSPSPTSTRSVSRLQRRHTTEKWTLK